MRRREFIKLIGSNVIAWPSATRAQQSTKIPRVGWLVTGSPTTYQFSLAAFLDGLKAVGRIEGQNIAIEYRWSLRLDICELDDLGPFLSFINDELAELDRRH
jgi:putative tryptophan/tyrosine transport system substrate-binding protein